MSHDFDIAVIGSGFAGSLMAMIAKKLGRSVILIERGKHPRFAIGESSTPLANLLLDELARRYDLPRLLPLTKWGAWQRTYPQIGCGLKRGFTFYQHHWGERFGPDPEHEHQLLVAASPRDEIADTHWFRADFDSFFVQQAQALGIEFIDETHLTEVELNPSSARLVGQRGGSAISTRARLVIDATGPRGFLHQSLRLPEVPFCHLPRTHGLFAHFTDVRRWDEMKSGMSEEVAPYAVDDAAVHHIFDGGWIWVLRFNNGITSAGVAATDCVAERFQFAAGESAWRRLLRELPAVGDLFRSARAVVPFTYVPRLSFLTGAVAGAKWVLLPSAAGFVDPLLSTGFPLTLLGIDRLARALERDWGNGRLEQSLETYSQATIDELLMAELLVAALYAGFKDFSTFSSLALLYFAAVSFSETARRLGRSELATGFLLREHPQFGPKARACCEWVLERNGELAPLERAQLRDRVLSIIEPIDVAGLSRTDRRNWFPANAADMIAAAQKLGVTASDVEQLLSRCGFAAADRPCVDL